MVDTLPAGGGEVTYMYVMTNTARVPELSLRDAALETTIAGILADPPA